MTPDPAFDPKQYWEKRLREHYSLAGVGYLRLGRRYNEWMYRVRSEVFERVLEGIASSETGGAALAAAWSPAWWRGRAVLDVGSGTGFYLSRWLGVGARATGLDLTDVAVEELRRSFPATPVVRADIGGPPEAIPLAPGSFDAASAMDVLFHLVDDAAYARAFVNLAALLRPGGWLLWSDNFLRREPERVAHQASRSLRESLRCVEGAGFEVVDRVPMFVIMNYPADTRSRLARWAWTAMVAPAAVAEPVGWLLGSLLFPVERRLVRRLRESPSTELMICRKRVFREGR
ncbi:MAG TPA: class I SAM-dependent methyltransferase [Gemmatimonadales bacterium]|nr:class I SAM-dependent methyltransferase [Gemmatimonadales bacterium]